MVNIDFTKAFGYIWDMLDAFNFVPGVINMFKALYNDAESAILNEGTTTQYFSLGRSARQYCPDSCLLFILALEPLPCHSV